MSLVDAVTNVPLPVNEPVRTYAPGSAERTSLEARLEELGSTSHDLTMTIAGEQRAGTTARPPADGAGQLDRVAGHLLEAGLELGALGRAGGVGEDRLVAGGRDTGDGVHGDLDLRTW